jgi:hypothetical protein
LVEGAADGGRRASGRIEARYGARHYIGMAVVAAGMIGAAVLHFIHNPAQAPTPSFNDPRFMLFGLLAVALAYYVLVGVSRSLNRQPQVVIDGEGIALGFGRDRRIAWNDIRWARLRRLALRPQLEFGLAPDAFVAANLRLSMWNLDDGLRPIRGLPSAVLVRDNGLDLSARAMLDAVKRFRPNLVKS